jgi:S1-C subfamily serine protease
LGARSSLMDVAVIRVNERNLPTANLEILMGCLPRWAIAIGNSLGPDNTVTAGIISAVPIGVLKWVSRISGSVYPKLMRRD